MAARAASHKQLRYAIYEYLQAIVKSGSMSEEQTESLEVAVQCVSEAFGFASGDAAEEERNELSVKPLTLPVVFNAGVQVLSGPTAAGASSPARSAPAAPQPEPAPAAAAPAPGAQAGADSPDDQGLFAKFVTTLESRGFFAGLTRGTVWRLPPCSRDMLQFSLLARLRRHVLMGGRGTERVG